MIYYFTTHSGTPYTPFAPTGDEAVAQGLAIKAEVPEGLSPWRLSLNLETNEAIVAYEGMSEEDAFAQKLIDDKAQFDASIAVSIAAQAKLESKEEKAAVEAS
jgi:hypothetical protein